MITYFHLDNLLPSLNMVESSILGLTFLLRIIWPLIFYFTFIDLGVICATQGLSHNSGQTGSQSTLDTPQDGAFETK